MIGRRRLLLMGLGLSPVVATAQASRPPRIAVLGMNPRQRQFAMLERSLVEAGLAPGRDIELAVFDDGGDYRSFPRLAAEAMRNPPALFLAPTIPAVEAAQKAAPSTPVVMISINDPVGAGLVKSLAQPGGMVTGLATFNEQTIGKVLDLTREVFPDARVVSVIHNPLNPSNLTMLRSIEAAMARSGGSAVSVPISAPVDTVELEARLAAARPDVAIQVPDYALAQMAATLAQAALRAKVPLAGTLRILADAGAFFTYGFDYESATQRAAQYVKRILAGASPADLPIEQPTRFLLVVNRKTAAALSVTLPPPFLARADEVIE